MMDDKELLKLLKDTEKEVEDVLFLAKTKPPGPPELLGPLELQ